MEETVLQAIHSSQNSLINQPFQFETVFLAFEIPFTLVDDHTLRIRIQYITSDSRYHERDLEEKVSNWARDEVEPRLRALREC